MKLGHTEILVTDPQAAKRFYVEVLGFELEADQGGQFIWVSMGDALFLLRPGRTAAPAPDYSSSRGLEFSGTDGSDRCPTFRDPDGNWFQLVNPADH
jgi:catechol 2,3-dioxygenase-like lactoylglutathione lyase family enzyme